MPDIFDQVADQQKQKGDIFDQVLPDKTAETIALVSPAGKNQMAARNAYGLPGAMEPVDARSRQAMLTPQNQQRYAKGTSMAFPEALLMAGPAAGAMVRAPLATLGKLATSAVGSTLGAEAGRYGARAFGGGETAQDVASTVGGLAGGVAGWREPPARLGFKGLGVEVPDALRPEGAARDAQETLGAFMNRGYQNVGDPELKKQEALGAFMNKGYRGIAPQMPQTLGGSIDAAGYGTRPAELEQEATQLARSPVVTPEQAARESQILPPRKPGEPELAYRARVLGLARAGRAGRGMVEPRW